MISGYFIILLMVLVPVLCCWHYNTWPDFAALAPAIFAVSMMYIPVAIAECVAYPPLIGVGSIYMAYITGNTITLKLPCALSALSMANVKQGSDEAKAVSLVAVGASSATVVILIILGMLLGEILSPILNSPVLQPCFNNVTPALMGTLLGTYIAGRVRYFVVAFAAAFVMSKLGMSFAVYMIVAIFITIIVGYYDSHAKEKKITK